MKWILNARNLTIACVLFAVAGQSERPVSALAADDSPVPSIRLNPLQNDDVTKAAFDLMGLPAATLRRLTAVEMSEDAWHRLFSVSVHSDAGVLGEARRPPVVGTYRVVGSVVRFQPRFPLEPGLPYQARFDPSRLPGTSTPEAATITALFRLPKRVSTDVTRVVRIDPTIDTLPENQLKLYVTFSAPMSRGDIYRHFHLLGPNGKDVDLPFLELGEELWDPSGKRLTLLFDPGRIKRGLKPREDAGPILEEGKQYTFVIDKDWEDAQGNLLAASVEKRFDVGPPDMVSPDPKQWRIDSPRARSREPLVVRSPEPLDRALFENLLSVEGGNGKSLPGEAAVGEDARVWRFTPRDPWRVGPHALVVGTELEDLAGNSVARPFEVDVFDRIPEKPQAAFVRLPFEPRPSQ